MSRTPVRPYRAALLGVPVLVACLVGLTTVPAGAASLYGSAAAAAGADDESSPTTSTSAGNCAVFANAGGMGSYCATGAGGDVPTLRQRFGRESFKPCRYGFRDNETNELISRVPHGMHTPPNKDPEKGHWWLRSCITGIDWGTVTGGRGKHLTVHLAWLPNDFDTGYHETPLSEYLWKQVAVSAQFPVPYIRAKPNFVPLVGVPAFFTFSWLDPGTQRPVLDPGAPCNGVDSCPWVQTTNNGDDMVMQASVKKITVNPMQEDMHGVDCGPGNPRYDESQPPDPTIQGDCYLLFDRSSASAREKSTKKIVSVLGDVYSVRVTITWKVMYGKDTDNLRELGDGFKSVSYQPLPVQEVQAPNIPPVMIF